MSWIISFLRGAASVVRRSRLEREMDDELRFHLETRADDLMRGGLGLGPGRGFRRPYGTQCISPHHPALKRRAMFRLALVYVKERKRSIKHAFLLRIRLAYERLPATALGRGPGCSPVRRSHPRWRAAPEP